MSPSPSLCATAHGNAPIRPIEGLRHSLIQTVRSLASGAGRSAAGLYLVDGPELVSRALDFGAPVQALIWADDALQHPEHQDLRRRAASIPSYAATRGLLGHALRFRPIPDVIAIVQRRLCPLGGLLAGSDLVAALERPANPSNLGMFLRSAEAAGLSGVAVAGEGADPFDRRSVRASRGGVFRLQLCQHPEPDAVIASARAAGMQIVATSANRGHAFVELDYRPPTLLLIGNEHTGLPATLQAAADATARVPMLGQVNSLNVAIAGTLVLYEALRQRGS